MIRRFELRVRLCLISIKTNNMQIKSLFVEMEIMVRMSTQCTE